MNITDILKQFEQIQNWSNAGLTAVCCLGVGYIWKMMKWKWFPNDAIPAVVCIAGISLFVAFSGHGKDQPDWSWHIRAGAIGFVIGFIVVMVHNFAISKIEDWIASKLAWLKTGSNTNAIDAPKPPPTIP